MLALITGASVGFGEAIARRFVKEGHQVILLARRKEKLQRLQEELGEQCLKVIARDINDLENIKKDLQDYKEKIDVLVNNAGLALGISPAHKSKLEHWEEMIQTNILGVVKLTHFLLPFMVQNQRGHIINLGSIAGSYAYPGSNIYGATKAFIKQFSLNLRADLLGTQVRVSNIEPGLCGGSEFSLVRFEGDTQKVNALYDKANPLLPEDIAEAVFWCASLPSHININRIELMPTSQASSALSVYKEEK